MKSPSHTLADINQKILATGEFLPEVTLKDGSRVQTGTVAAMMANIELFNGGEDVARELEAAVPTLIKVGLFTLFSPEEWLLGNNKGRHFVANKALEYMAAHK